MNKEVESVILIVFILALVFGFFVGRDYEKQQVEDQSNEMQIKQQDGKVEVHVPFVDIEYDTK